VLVGLVARDALDLNPPGGWFLHGIF